MEKFESAGVPVSRQNRGRTMRNRKDEVPRQATKRTLSTMTSTVDRPTVTAPFRAGTLKLIPLGGLGEIGKNMFAYEQGDDIIVVDCGIMFPEEEMLGVDFVIPDIKYLVERKHKIKGIIFTHGHEDHIGGTPYLWPKLGAPMYATQLTAGLIKVKLDEFNIANPPITVVNAGEKIQLGVFNIEFVQMAHSIPDEVALYITTENAKIFHVTDWKIDHTPIFRQKTDLTRIAEIGAAGLTALLSDSTNAEQPGYTLSERVVTDAFDEIFSQAEGRVIVAMFASLINRMQQVIDMCVKHKRKLAVSGRSLENNINMALQLGYLKMPDNLLIDIHKLATIPDNEVAILATGSQGEEYSALVRMAGGEHRQIKIKKGDTVVISASPIPGNEPSIYETIDNLFKQGANVIYGKSFDIHVSGHAAQEELKLMIALSKPEYFVPIHGEYHHLKRHGQLARKMGVKDDNIFVIENGHVVEFDKGKAKVLDTRVQAGYVLVDGSGVGDVGNIVLRDRQAMAKDGIFVIILTVERQTGKLVTSPDIISRGFIYMREREDLVFESRQEVKRIFSRHNEKYPLQWDMIKRLVRDDLAEFLYGKTERRPMVIPVIIEV